MERRFNLRTIRCSNLNTAFQIIKPRFSIFAQTGLKSIMFPLLYFHCLQSQLDSELVESETNSKQEKSTDCNSNSSYSLLLNLCFLLLVIFFSYVTEPVEEDNENESHFFIVEKSISPYYKETRSNAETN